MNELLFSQGVLVSGQIHTVEGDIVGRDKNINVNLGKELSIRELRTIFAGASVRLEAVGIKPKRFERKKAKLFRTHIAPAYAQISIIVHSYADEIYALRQQVLVAKSAEDIVDARNSFADRRRALVRERDRLLATLEAVLDCWRTEIKDKTAVTSFAAFVNFTQSLKSYFLVARFRYTKDRTGISRDPVNDLPFPSSLASSLLETMRYAVAADGSTLLDCRRYLEDLLSDAIMNLEETEKIIHRSFAALSLICIG